MRRLRAADRVAWRRRVASVQQRAIATWEVGSRRVNRCRHVPSVTGGVMADPWYRSCLSRIEGLVSRKGRRGSGPP